MIKVKNGMGVLTKIQPDGNEREEICDPLAEPQW